MYIFSSTEPAPSPQAALSFQKLLDKTAGQGLTSGIFHFPLSLHSRILEHNGAPDEYLTQQEWIQCMFELDKSSENAWTEGARRTALQYSSIGEVPIMIACVKYRGPKADFLAEIVEAFARDREIVMPDNLTEAIQENIFFGATPLLPSRYEGFSRLPFSHKGLSVNYRMVDPVWENKEESRLPDIFVDVDDGAGLRRIGWGDGLRVVYAAPGVKTIRVHARSGGRELVALGSLDIHTGSEPPRYNEEWNLTNGTAWVWYGEKNAALTRPIIMCEGFPGGYTWESLYDKYNQCGLLTDLLAGGKDFILVSFGDMATKGIFECAAILQECIMKANERKRDPASIMVGGASMGGLVARCALLNMQKANVDPQTSTMISFDSPHCGAYLPVSVQTFLYYFSKANADANSKLELLTSKSAKEMLVYFAADGKSGSLISQERSDFLAKVKGLGEYPRGIDIIALADGRGDGVIQEKGGTAHGLSIKYHAEIDPVVSARLYNLPSQTDDWVEVSNLYYVIIDCLRKIKWEVRYTDSYDGAQGGLGNVYSDVKRALDCTHCGTNAQCSLDNNCFIPTVSAVGIGGDPMLPIDMKKSPFARVYVSPKNLDHVELEEDMKTWLMQFIFPASKSAARATPSS